MAKFVQLKIHLGDLYCRKLLEILIIKDALFVSNEYPIYFLFKALQLTLLFPFATVPLIY